jgi:hypothetical protein
MNYGPFEIAKDVRQCILNSAAEIMNYSKWSDDCSVRELRELIERIKESMWFSPIDPAAFTEQEMRELGFERWSEEDPMYLIPLWLFPFLSEEVNCCSINGKKYLKKKKSEMDTDNRYGCLAYGVTPKEK